MNIIRLERAFIFMSTPPSPVSRENPARWPLILLRILVLGAVLSGGVLLLSDVLPLVAARLAHAPTSALPLLLIGTTYALAQLRFRPHRWELVQALLVSTAFICWGIYQLLPASAGATFLGDLVITMYVVDLSLGIGKQLRRTPRSATSASLPPMRELGQHAHEDNAENNPHDDRAGNEHLSQTGGNARLGRRDDGG